VTPVVFGAGVLGFPLPGMSDVMPYPSSRWSELDEAQLGRYRDAWLDHLRRLADTFHPDVIHSHHVWLMSSFIKDVWPDVPVVTHCHATGLRQMALCPHLAQRVEEGVRRNERFVVLHGEQAVILAEALDFPEERITVVGAGFREDLFFTRTTSRAAPRHGNVLYAGKLARAKGLPWLLDAVASLGRRHSGLTLHVAGGGEGSEAEDIRRRMAELRGIVHYHGRLDQPGLADLMRQCAVFVLPSFYEGLPLVLVEALASGCRLISTDLTSVRQELVPHLGAALDVVPLPRLEGVDQPHHEDLPRFIESLELALEATLDRPPLDDPAKELPGVLDHFTWGSVFERVERIWSEVLNC